MFKLNLKIALRNLWKNKSGSIINISGLAIGLASCLMLLTYVSYEWTFDKHSKNANNIYQVMTNVKDEDGKIFMTFDGTTTALGPLLKQHIPEIEAISRSSYTKVGLIANGEKAFKKEGRFAEPGILKIYDYQFIAGDKNTALSAPNSILITRKTANTLFGTTDVLHKQIRYQDKMDLEITAVVEDLPDNSSSKFDFLMPWSLYETIEPYVKDLTWDSYSFVTQMALRPDADLKAVNKKVDQVVKANTESAQVHFLFPLTKLHLYGKFENGKSVGGAIEQVWLFIGLAFGILLIACINFMNMATAKSERRAKEVGIKKTIGANRGSLIVQFLTEAMVLTLISVLIAVALVELFLPTFSRLLQIEMNMSYFNISTIIGILAIVLATGLLAGSYPAFYLSSFNPIQNLKKRIRSIGMFSFTLRQALVVGQFTFTIILLVGTLVIYKQIQFIKNKPIGAEINALVELPQDGELKPKFELLKTRLLNSGAVEAMCQTSINLSHRGHNFRNISWPGIKEDNMLMFNKVATTYDFIKTNGIKLLQGRDFSPQYGSDSSAVMVSASAVKAMDLKDPIGKTIHILDDPFTIIGVFNDFVWDSPYTANNPMVVLFDNYQKGVVTMRLNSKQNMQESIAKITEIVKEINPAYPVELKFMNEIYEQKFKSEATLGVLSNLFGGLAIFISCLGLYGLVAYSAEQRTKEFGVRKVLGASVTGIMSLLSVSFVKMIFFSMLIAIPIAIYAMNNWLKRFEYHTTISWWIIVAAAFGTLLIALITISFQAYKLHAAP
ncbi:MAG: ABC transporter permease, partial [Pedobacter sp.]